MLTNFTAGHSLSDFLFDLKDFENSLYTNFLFSPDGLAMPGYVFASNIMGRHVEGAKQKGVTPLVEVGLLDGVFVPFLSSHVIEKGGLKAIANDLEKRDGRGVYIGAKEVAASLVSLGNINEQCIPDNRNYGIKTDELVTSLVQKRDFVDDEEFSKYWNDEEVKLWRSVVIDKARERTAERRKDGTYDVGMKVARVLDVLAEQLDIGQVNLNKTSFSPNELFNSVKNKEQEQKAKRFLKIICFLFNESIAWAMDAQPNWPIQDEDFFRFQLDRTEFIRTVEDHWTDSVEGIIEIPSLDVLRVCDSTTLRNIRRIGDDVFFPTFREWSNNPYNGEELISQLEEYMERARCLIKESPSVKARCVAGVTKQSNLPKLVAVSLGGAIGGVLGGAAGIFTIGLDPALIVGAGAGASAGSSLASHYIDNGVQAYTSSHFQNRTKMQRIKLGRATDITLLQ